MKKIRALLTCLCIAALAACGGGGSNSQSSPTKAIPGLSLLAGMLGGSGNTDGPTGRFLEPDGVAVDAAGNLFIADYGNDTVRKRTPDGVVTTLAGSPGNSGSTDGIGGAARFAQPSGIGVDSVGNVYVTDNNGLRKITPNGAVTTLVPQPANSTTVSGLAVDANGFVYVAGGGSNVVLKISPAGVVAIYAGTGVSGSADGPAAQATFSYAAAVAFDPAGNLYVADRDNCTVRHIATNGSVTTVAGAAGLCGAADGTGTSARFAGPTGIAVDATGTVYVADAGTYQAFNNTIRKISVNGVVSTLAGKVGVNTPLDGVGVGAGFGDPRGIAVDASGNVYVADDVANAVRKVTASGVVTTVAGLLPAVGAVDGIGSAASFNGPGNIAVDASGAIYVADSNNNLIRKVTSAGVTTTLAGVAGVGGATDGTLLSATFQFPGGVAVGPAGTVYVADTGNHLIRKISPSGTVVTIAGADWPTACICGVNRAPGSAPVALAVDGAGNVFVADAGLSLIRKVAADGTASVLVTSVGATGIAIDSAGNLYVSDSVDQTIRKFSPSGQGSVIAGTPGVAGSADGSGAAATFNNPSGLSLDGAGNLFVADSGNQVIRKVTSAGVVTTVAGQVGSIGVILGSLPGSLNFPIGMAVAGNGVLYTTTENSVVKIQLP